MRFKIQSLRFNFQTYFNQICIKIQFFKTEFWILLESSLATIFRSIFLSFVLTEIDSNTVAAKKEAVEPVTYFGPPYFQNN